MRAALTYWVGVAGQLKIANVASCATIYRPSQAAPFLAAMTIVYYDYKPKRAGRQKHTVDFPCGRIVSARKPKPRHYGEIRMASRMKAQRTALIAAFMERALKPQG